MDPYFDFNACRAGDENHRVDFSVKKPDWHTVSTCSVLPGCRHITPSSPEEYRMAARVAREAGEVVLCSLLAPEMRLNDLRKRIYRFVLDNFEPENYPSYGGLYLAAAYYKAKKFGIEL